MKTLNNHKSLLLAVAFFSIAVCAHCYPPDNAAVLYYKAAVVFEVDDEMADALSDLRQGNIELNDQIREFVEKNRRIIDTLTDASEIKNCDWGMDLLQGLEMDMPPLGALKKLAFLLVADAKILAADGKHKAAVDRCMSLYKMARHVNDRIFISYLVGIAIEAMTNNCLIQIMSDMPQDTEMLAYLKNRLVEIDSIPLSIKPALVGEREAMLIFMTTERMEDVVRLCGGNEEDNKRLLSLDAEAIERNREYYREFVACTNAAFDMPYLEGSTQLKDLEEKMEKDVKAEPELILTGTLVPAIDRVFSLKTRIETHNNAVRTAVEVYMIEAKTGKLPDALPSGLLGDMFSGKPFQFEKTAEGFVLRCKGKDLSKDEVYEYKFKVN